jgi:hypothetical protein
VAIAGERPDLHGKEGVDGSSPSEGFTDLQAFSSVDVRVEDAMGTQWVPTLRAATLERASWIAFAARFRLCPSSSAITCA